MTSKKNIKKKKLNKKTQTDWKKLRRMKDSQIDYSDIPPINFEELGEGQLQLPIAKSPLSIRIDQDVVAFFKKGGRGYQSRMNAVLRSYMHHFKHHHSISR